MMFLEKKISLHTHDEKKVIKILRSIPLGAYLKLMQVIKKNTSTYAIVYK